MIHTVTRRRAVCRTRTGRPVSPLLPTTKPIDPVPCIRSIDRALSLGLALAAILLLIGPGLSGRQSARAQREPVLPETVFAEGFKLYADHLYEQSIEVFDTFRKRYPDHVSAPEALYYQAEAALTLGREDEAIRLFSRFQELYPVHPLAFQARLALGKYFYEAGDYEQALRVLSEVLASDPLPDLAAKALYWMGESATHLGRLDDAVGYYQRAADEYRETSTAPIALYAIAVAEVRRERYDAAANAFELLAARYPNSPYAQNIGLALAEVYYELGDYPRAVTEIRRRLPNLSGEAKERATFLLAESYNQLRDYDDAIIYYRRFSEGNPDSPYFRRALYGLAWNYHFESAYQWAADEFDRVRAGFDDDLAAEATYYAAVNRKLSADPEAALRLFKETADRWPQHALADHALYELGLTDYELHRWKEANETFGRLIRSYPESELLGEAYYQRGNTFIALGRFNEALESFDRAVALDAAPESLKEEVVFQKAWLLYRSRNFAEAAPAFMTLYQENPRGPKAGEALFWAAESFYQSGALDRSVRLFQKYLKDYPAARHVEAAHYALGWVYFKKGDFSLAITEFKWFLDHYRESGETVPYRTDARLRLADSYYALKRYPEAIRIYSIVAAEGEDYALYQTAQAYSNAGDAFEAITKFRELLVEYPQSEYREEAQYSLGYLYFLNQDYDRAIEEYQSLIEDYPRDPLAAKAQYGIGDALFNAGRLEEAVEAYQNVLTRYPESPFIADAAAGIQYALLALDDEARAAEIIDAFIAEHPDSPIVDELRFRQAEAKFQGGQEEEALGGFLAFIRTARSETLLPEAYFYVGSIYADRGQIREAQNYLRRLIEQYPDSPRRADAARRLGELYASENRNEDALRTFRLLESIANRTKDGLLLAQARYGQSIALMNLGRHREAEDLLQEAIAAAPDSPQVIPARLGLARLYESDGKTAEALRLYREIAGKSRDETGAEALVRLGELLLENGDAEKAIEELGRLPVLFPNYVDRVARGYLTQARAFRQLGRTGEALRLYELLTTRYAGTDAAEIAAREKTEL